MDTAEVVNAPFTGVLGEAAAEAMATKHVTQRTCTNN
jgi:hypothetical protein